MKTALISDIHSNLPALKAVLEDIHQENPDAIYCAGDIVGYGAQPSECIEKVSEVCETTVAGNHDWGAIGKANISSLNDWAQKAILWTAEQISYNEKRILAELPIMAYISDALIVHGTPKAPENWDYLLYASQLPAQFAAFSERLCFIGHSHSPLIWTESGEGLLPYYDRPFILNKSERYIINVGSVGQPRDGDTRSCYVIFDDENMSVRFKRIEYNIDKATALIREAGLPEILASRLYLGN